MKVPFSYKQVLSCKALKFVADLHSNFNGKRLDLIAKNGMIKKISPVLQNNSMLKIKNLRNGNAAAELNGRHIEFIDPDEKNKIKDVFLSDKVSIVNFDCGNDLSWECTIEMQINLKESVRIIPLFNEADSDSDTIVEKLTSLIVQPRSFSKNENNFLIDKEPVSAAFFDFGLFVYHNAKKLLDHGYMPHFYFAEVKNHQAAIFWNEILSFSENQLGLPKESIQASVSF